MTTRASGADVCALRGPTRMVLRVASQLLPSGHRQRFLREWTAEAVTPGSDVSQFVFAVRVLRGALGTSLALRDGVERALFQLGLAVPFAATGPLFFIGLALYRNDLGPAAGYALFVLALFIGGLSVWQGHLEALAHTRTHVAGAALAVSNLFMAALPSKLPTDEPLARHDDVALLAVACSVALIVMSNYPPLIDRRVARLGFAFLAVGAIGVATADLHNLVVLHDGPIRLGLLLTGTGSLASSGLIVSGIRRGDLFATLPTADPPDPSEGTPRLLQ